MIKDAIIFVLVLVVFLLIAYIIRLRRINKEVKENCIKTVKDMFKAVSNHMFDTLEDITAASLKYVSDEDMHNFVADMINIGKIHGLAVDVESFENNKERENKNESN